MLLMCTQAEALVFFFGEILLSYMGKFPFIFNFLSEANCAV
jgi:hypothetical protein